MTLDPEAIDNIRSLGGGDPEGFLREIIEIFLTDTPARMNDMSATLAAQDLAGFSRAAHSIKGSAANLGAVSLKAAAENAESACRVDLAAGATALDALRAEFVRTRQALEAVRDGTQLPGTS